MRLFAKILCFTFTALLLSMFAFNAIADDKYFFRHKSPDIQTNAPIEQRKDITAFFTGGVGYSFTNRLPLKSEWEDDSWSITSGSLPAGITFNPETRTFSGIPTQVSAGYTVELAGVDNEGRTVADASVTFDIFDVSGEAYFPEIYAHTGKYKFDQLPVPNGEAIYSWNIVDRLPDGVQINGRNLDGTPLASGISSFFIQGLSYQGNVIATYIGNYVVEDGPTFPTVQDNIRTLPPSGSVTVSLSPMHINNSISGDLSKVKYYVELASGDTLPGTMVTNHNTKNLIVSGVISKPYDTARMRWKAVDTDGTEGFSDWFTIGTSDREFSCASGNRRIEWITGVDVDTKINPPTGSAGTLEYELVSGALPAGITLDIDGSFRGSTIVSTPATEISVEVTSVVDETRTTAPACKFVYVVNNQHFELNHVELGQAAHMRAGTLFNASIGVSGGIPDYNVSFDGEYPTVFITSATENTDLVEVEGSISDIGMPFAIKFSALNGDGETTTGNIPVYSYPPLSFGEAVPDFSVKRLAKNQVFGSIPYDANSVIPDISGVENYPVMTLSNQAALPLGLVFGTPSEPYSFTGEVVAPVGTYGPFSVTMSDMSGETVVSDLFNIVIEERDPIVINAVTPPVFTVDFGTETRMVSTDITQPDGAKSFNIIYTLSGPELPSGVTFDTNTSEFIGAEDIDISLIGSYGPYIITATDSEGSTAESDEFDITIIDWPAPSGVDALPVELTVSGTLSQRSLFSSINQSTIIGGIDGVTFTSLVPAAPGGLTFNNGILSGTATSEYSGMAIANFKDARDRVGFFNVPILVKALPVIEMANDSYDIPRLSEVGPLNILPTKKSGFWTARAVTWGLDTGSILPNGLSVDPNTGKLVGQTDAEIGTQFQDIVIRAVTTDPESNEFIVLSNSFDLTITSGSELTLDYDISSGNKLTYKLDYDSGRVPPYSLVEGPVPGYSVLVGGSYVPNLEYTIKTMPDGLSNIGINGSNGRLTGYPDKLGTWTLPIEVKDAENSTAATALTIHSTLAGNILLQNASSQVETLRVGEPFTFPAGGTPIIASNFVGDVIYSTVPSYLPNGVDGHFSGATGVFSDESRFVSASGNGVRIEVIQLNATDDDNRTLLKPVTLKYYVYDPVELVLSQNTHFGEQYQSSVDITFPVAKNIIGDATYTISGDVPGTLITKKPSIHNNGYEYSWYSDSDERRHIVYTNEFFEVTRHEVVGASDKTVVSLALSDNLPLDALIFDTINPRLSGTPSKSGAFSLTLNVEDSHMFTYIKPVSSVVENNTASANFTLQIIAAPALIASNNMSAETIHLNTSVPTIVSTIQNAAYGKPVTWTKTAGTLPSNVTFVEGSNSLSYSGYPSALGTYSGIVFTAKDVAGRTVSVPAVSFTVANRLPLEIVGAETIYREVNSPISGVSFTATNVAFGNLIKTEDWVVTGVLNLPNGITYAANNGILTFSGTPTLIGEFEGVVIQASDSAGGIATLPIKMVIYEPSSPIVLNVSGVTTKVGIPISITPVVTNTYGNIKYVSEDISETYSSNLSLSSTSGEITGSFSTIGDRIVNISVSDSTERLTSEPLTIKIIPNLRVLVPNQISAEQYVSFNTDVDTAFSIGTVTYAKGNPTSWPDGLSVDPSTGTISGTINNKGVYSGLYITATDTFGAHTDTQSSNEFSIDVSKSLAEPDIADITGMKVFTIESPITPIVPVVTEKSNGKSWSYSGLEFSLNKPLPTGFNFDTSTGIISGTPEVPSFTEELIITVTDVEGNVDSTTPFDIAVRDLVPDLPTIANYAPETLRVGQSFVTAPALTVGRPAGNVTFSIGSTNLSEISIDPTTGVLSGTITNASNTTPTTVVLATDQSGYQFRLSPSNPGSAVLPISVVAPSISYTNTIGVTSSMSANVLPTVSHMENPVMYSINNDLPYGMSIDSSTGKISGTTLENGNFPGFVVTATDTYGSVTSNTFAISANIVERWRLVIDKAIDHHSVAHCVALAEFEVYYGSDNITGESLVYPSKADAGNPASALTDGITKHYIGWASTKQPEKKSIYFTPPANQPFSSITLYARGDGYPHCTPTDVSFEKSVDGINWTNVQSLSNIGIPINGSVTLNRP